MGSDGLAEGVGSWGGRARLLALRRRLRSNPELRLGGLIGERSLLRLVWANLGGSVGLVVVSLRRVLRPLGFEGGS